MKKQANIFRREYWSYTKQNIIGHVTQLKQQREYLLSICFIESELLSSKFKKRTWISLAASTGDEAGGLPNKRGQIKM
jgi:hypothetical protein